MKTLRRLRVTFIFLLFTALIAHAPLAYSNDGIPKELIGSWCLDAGPKLVEILNIKEDGTFTSIEFKDDSPEGVESNGIIQIFERRKRSRPNWLEEIKEIFVYLGLYSNSNSKFNIYESTEAGFGVREDGNLEILIASLKQYERIYRKCTETEKRYTVATNLN